MAVTVRCRKLRSEPSARRRPGEDRAPVAPGCRVVTINCHQQKDGEKLVVRAAVVVAEDKQHEGVSRTDGRILFTNTSVRFMPSAQ